MKLFDNKVQERKYNVLREVAIQTWRGNDVFAEFNEISSKVIPKDEPPQRCCIYKDRAVIAERIRLANRVPAGEVPAGLPLAAAGKPVVSYRSSTLLVTNVQRRDTL